MYRSPSSTILRYATLSCVILLSYMSACATTSRDSTGKPTEHSPRVAQSVPPAAIMESPESTIERASTLFSVDSGTVLESARRFANEIQHLIDRGDFDGWKRVLSDAYRKYYDDSRNLARISQYVRLRREGIVLDSLRDYFEHVVRESRDGTSVDRVEVMDDRHAIAYTEVDGKEFVLYGLLWDDGWKIDRY